MKAIYQPERGESHPPFKKRKRDHIRDPSKTFLFIKSAHLEPFSNRVQTYVLICPACSRKSFTSLQGLLNHARISHGLEWGTHDECITACAVQDLDVDVEYGIEVGLTSTGILPGLRSLFQIAVGARSALHSVPQNGSDSQHQGSHTAETTPGSHLARTLVFTKIHQRSPPSLGRRCSGER